MATKNTAIAKVRPKSKSKTTGRVSRVSLPKVTKLRTAKSKMSSSKGTKSRVTPSEPAPLKVFESKVERAATPNVSSFRSEVIYSRDLVFTDGFGEDHLLIYDQILDRFADLKPFLAQFAASLAVRGGEALKDVNGLPSLLRRVLDATEKMNLKKLKIVALGGGSVGDFAGFLASIYKRGVGLVQIPSTWLSAIDSAHGGKNALNVGSIKNQIGTFYPAEKVYILESLLRLQPPERALEGFGELIKIFLLGSTHGEWTKIQISSAAPDLPAILWQNLSWAVEKKYQIVEVDPYERTGYRQILNFGHTVGHVFEVAWRLPHGLAVLQGMIFALEWSRHRKILSEPDFEGVMQKFENFGVKRMSSPLRESEAREMLAQDKKVSGPGQVNFVFLQKPGQPLVERINLQDLLSEMKRQKVI